MKVYKLLADPKRFSNFAFTSEADAPIYRKFDGQPLAKDWQAADITPADVDPYEAELGDFAMLGTIPIFNVRAATLLLPMLKPNGELLPLKFDREEYLAYNVTRVIDALDEARSEIKRFSTGRVMSVDTYSFRTHAVEGCDIFKISQLRRGYVFVSDSFVAAVRDARLAGFHFLEQWSSIDAS